MKFDTLFPLQVVINLDKRPDRLKLCMEQEFPVIKIHPLRKPGLIYEKTNNKWWNGAIGCMLSHYQILEAAALLDTNVFIFEDDVFFIGKEQSDFGYKIYMDLSTASVQLNNIEWDMFYIGGNILKPFNQVSSHLAKLNHCQSTVAYGVNKKFLRTLLGYIDLTHINRPIDVIYADSVIPNHNCYISVPMLAIQRDSFSDIEGGEMKYSEYLERRYTENFIPLTK
jgi:GR25 family glycosyltransferase involved in LPS biosynthesis